MNCLLCGSDRREALLRGSDRLYATTTERFLVVRCLKCGMARMEPAPGAHEIAGFYPPQYWFRPDPSMAGTLEERYRRVILRDHVRFAERAIRHSGERGPVIDVGCGGGLFLRLLRERGFSVVGLDNSQGAARLAWGGNGVPAFCADLAHSPVAPLSCAAITMYHVLEHLPDPRSYLGAARTALRPNGRLIVQVPNLACWQFALLGRSWNGIDIPRHLHNFRAVDLRRLLAESGFEVVRTKHFSWRDNPAGLATSLAPDLDPVARRVRNLDRSPRASLVKDFLYLGLVMASIPFAGLEAVFGAGSTVTVEARKKS